MNSNTVFLECCLDQSRQPYIGVDSKCDKLAIFCLEHSPHKNEEGLFHKMMPLKDLKRTIHEKKFFMQEKIDILLIQYNKFMDKLISEVKELQMRKSLELSMLWLRELAQNQQQYELMRKIYRMEFGKLSCQDINSVYYKMIHNEELEKKNVNELDCYKGIYEILNKLNGNITANAKIVQKVSEIEGLVEDGKVLRKVLPDKRVINSRIRQVLLQEGKGTGKYCIRYHNAVLMINSNNYMSVYSKYPILAHTTYHINIKTKYNNVMIGICGEKVKSQTNLDLHYSNDSLVYNCSNGCIYEKGQFKTVMKASMTNLNKQFILKLKVTETELILSTNKEVIARQQIKLIHGKIYLHLLSRTKADSFEIERDKDLSSDNAEFENHPDSSQNDIEDRFIDKVKQESQQSQSMVEENKCIDHYIRVSEKKQENIQELLNKFKTKRESRNQGFVKKGEKEKQTNKQEELESPQRERKYTSGNELESPLYIELGEDSPNILNQKNSIYKRRFGRERKQSDKVSQFSEISNERQFRVPGIIQRKMSDISDEAQMVNYVNDRGEISKMMMSHQSIKVKEGSVKNEQIESPSNVNIYIEDSSGNEKSASEIKTKNFLNMDILQNSMEESQSIKESERIDHYTYYDSKSKPFNIEVNKV